MNKRVFEGYISNDWETGWELFRNTSYAEGSCPGAWFRGLQQNENTGKWPKIRITIEELED